MTVIVAALVVIGAVETVTELELRLLWVRKLTSDLFGHVVGDVKTYTTRVPTHLIVS
jgi:hypothetical protein